MTYSSLYAPLTRARETRVGQGRLRAPCSRYKFPKALGRACPWTSSHSYPRQARVMTPFGSRRQTDYGGKIRPTMTDVSAKEIAALFLREVFRVVGMPQDLITDGDPRFTGKFFAEICRFLGVKQCLSTAYHPQSDSQTERMNRVLDMLRHRLGRVPPSHGIRCKQRPSS
jgi:transposase InsO family protein